MSRISTARLLQIDLDPGATKPLYRQVYDAIRLAVLSGRLKPGDALPSTRALSRELGVARSTTVLAFDQLRAEGYLSGPPGAPTRVSTVLPDSLTHSTRADRGVLTARPRPISGHVAEVRQTPDLTGDGRPRAPRPFRAAVPALDGFPMSTWTACVNRELRRTPPRHLSYGDPRGLRELREAVSAYLRSARGVNCTPDQVLIVAGSQHALSLCLEVLVDPGGEVWVEDPGYFGTQGAVRASGAQLVPIPVTTEGVDVEYGRARAPNARVAFVTPARQLPLGMTMPLNRRLALLSWAADAESWIVEDDYDSEFRYASRPLGALQGLDREQCVLFTGTFSKVLFPAIRLGYLVVPESVSDAFIAARHFNGFSCPYLEQAALARFMNEGHFERHVRRMRSLYGTRRDMLLTSVGRYLRGRAQVGVADGGLGVVLWLQHGDSEEAIAATSHRFGVELLPLGRMTVAHAIAPGFFLGFGGLPETEIAKGVRVLAKAIEEYDRKRRAAV